MGIVQSSELKTGYQIMEVKHNSPISKAGLVCYFDFIVAVNGMQVIKETPNILVNTANDYIGREITLAVYNSRNESYREVRCTPTAEWPGQGILGCAIRFCFYDDATNWTRRVLSVHPKSPASEAGLVAWEGEVLNLDYIVASSMTIFESDEILSKIVREHNKMILPLTIYNTTSEQFRNVEITPNSDWSNEYGA